MKPFIDAHCHYDAAAFQNYCGDGVFICNSASEGDWAPVLAAAKTDARIRAAIGLHPWFVCGATHGWTDRMADVLSHNPAVMVGEIGLDATRENMAAQRAAFAAQYEMAARFGRGAHIHCVHEWAGLINCIKSCPPPPVTILHRFGGSPQIMDSLLRLGGNIYFSFSDLHGVRARNAAAHAPLGRILVETDGAAPNPQRIFAAISQIADIRGTSFDEMAAIVYDNALKVIKNGQTA